MNVLNEFESLGRLMDGFTVLKLAALDRMTVSEESVQPASISWWEPLVAVIFEPVLRWGHLDPHPVSVLPAANVAESRRPGNFGE